MRYPIDEGSRKPYRIKEDGKKVLITKDLKAQPSVEKANMEKLKKANAEIIERAKMTDPLVTKKEEPKKK